VGIHSETEKANPANANGNSNGDATAIRIETGETGTANANANAIGMETGEVSLGNAERNSTGSPAGDVMKEKTKRKKKKRTKKTRGGHEKKRLRNERHIAKFLTNEPLNLRKPLTINWTLNKAGCLVYSISNGEGWNLNEQLPDDVVICFESLHNIAFHERTAPLCQALASIPSETLSEVLILLGITEKYIIGDPKNDFKEMLLRDRTSASFAPKTPRFTVEGKCEDEPFVATLFEGIPEGSAPVMNGNKECHFSMESLLTVVPNSVIVKTTQKIDESQVFNSKTAFGLLYGNMLCSPQQLEKQFSLTIYKITTNALLPVVSCLFSKLLSKQYLHGTLIVNFLKAILHHNSVIGSQSVALALLHTFHNTSLLSTFFDERDCYCEHLLFLFFMELIFIHPALCERLLKGNRDRFCEVFCSEKKAAKSMNEPLYVQAAFDLLGKAPNDLQNTLLVESLFEYAVHFHFKTEQRLVNFLALKEWKENKQFQKLAKNCKENPLIQLYLEHFGWRDNTIDRNPSPTEDNRYNMDSQPMDSDDHNENGVDYDDGSRTPPLLIDPSSLVDERVPPIDEIEKRNSGQPRLSLNFSRMEKQTVVNGYAKNLSFKGTSSVLEVQNKKKDVTWNVFHLQDKSNGISLTVGTSACVFKGLLAREEQESLLKQVQSSATFYQYYMKDEDAFYPIKHLIGAIPLTEEMMKFNGTPHHNNYMVKWQRLPRCSQLLTVLRLVAARMILGEKDGNPIIPNTVEIALYREEESIRKHIDSDFENEYPICVLVFGNVGAKVLVYRNEDEYGRSYSKVSSPLEAAGFVQPGEGYCMLRGDCYHAREALKPMKHDQYSISLVFRFTDKKKLKRKKDLEVTSKYKPPFDIVCIDWSNPSFGKPQLRKNKQGPIPSRLADIWSRTNARNIFIASQNGKKLHFAPGDQFRGRPLLNILELHLAYQGGVAVSGMKEVGACSIVISNSASSDSPPCEKRDDGCITFSTCCAQEKLTDEIAEYFDEMNFKDKEKELSDVPPNTSLLLTRVVDQKTVRVFIGPKCRTDSRFKYQQFKIQKRNNCHLYYDDMTVSFCGRERNKFATFLLHPSSHCDDSDHNNNDSDDNSMSGSESKSFTDSDSESDNEIEQNDNDNDDSRPKEKKQKQ